MPKSHGPRPIEIPWETKRCESSSDCSTIVLQESSGSSQSGSELVRSGLCLRDTINPRSMGRTGLVDSAPINLEWEELYCSQATDDHRDGCVTNRLGGILQRHTDRRSMDNRGAEPPHKLPRVTSGISRSPDICENIIRDNNPVENGQYVSPHLHQQDGWNCVQNTHILDKTTMDVVPRERYHSCSPASTRIQECDCRCGITTDDRSVGLATGPMGVPADQQSIGPDRDRPLCVSPDTTGVEVCELEARPVGGSPGRLHSGLEPVQSVCQSTMELNRQGTSICQRARSTNNSGGTSMEISSLVSDTPGNVSRLPSSDTTEGRPVQGNPSGSNAGNTATISRVAYLRNRYQEHQLSEEASNLLLASWREKSSKSYDSLFNKWVGWCNKRNTDPISGPVSEVVNFLTDLFEQGYQYRSLNSYRSAISSTHDLVDGVSIGQHPLVTRLLKGAFNQRPPLPRYSDTWKVDTVTDYIKSLPSNNLLSLTVLTVDNSRSSSTRVFPMRRNSAR